MPPRRIANPTVRGLSHRQDRQPRPIEPEFCELYREYAGRVASYAATVLDSEDDVEDVTQQVFLSVFEALGASSVHDFEPWLFRVVRNHAIDQLRKRRRSAPEVPGAIEHRREQLEADLRRPSADPQLSCQLAESIEALPFTQREVLGLHYLLDLTHARIGALLGRSEASVRQLHSRALRGLRQQLAGSGPIG